MITCLSITAILQPYLYSYSSSLNGFPYWYTIWLITQMIIIIRITVFLSITIIILGTHHFAKDIENNKYSRVTNKQGKENNHATGLKLDDFLDQSHIITLQQNLSYKSQLSRSEYPNSFESSSWYSPPKRYPELCSCTRQNPKCHEKWYFEYVDHSLDAHMRLIIQPDLNACFVSL